MNTTERMWQHMEKVDKLLDALGFPKEPPQGSFYDLTADEDEQPAGDETPKRKSGGQPGNQNARKHGFYSKHLPPEQMKQLKGVTIHMGLEPEIALLRIRLNELLDDPEVSPDLINRTLSVLAKLMAIQRRYVYG